MKSSRRRFRWRFFVNFWCRLGRSFQARLKQLADRSHLTALATAVRTLAGRFRLGLQIIGRRLKLRPGQSKPVTGQLTAAPKLELSQLSHRQQRRQKRLQERQLQALARPEGFWARFFWRLHYRQLIRYWFSWRIIRRCLLLALVGLLSVLVVGYLIYDHYRADLPTDINSLQKCLQGQTTRYYDHTGQTLLWASKADVDCLPITSLNQVSRYLLISVLIAEDQNFYQHDGFDQGSIVRAAWNNLLGRDLQGGSTITQQYVKNAILKDRQRNLSRKIKELILAIELEKKFTKDEILTAYLNTISFGSVYDGIQSASFGYFDKSADKLDLAESSLLAATIPAPSRFWSQPQVHIQRQQKILTDLLAGGLISQAEYDQARAIDILSRVRQQRSQYDSITAPHFVLEVEKRLQSDYGYDSNVRLLGLNVITTIDLEAQKIAQDSVELILDDIDQRGFDNAAAVAVDVSNGAVLAQVGSRDFNYPGFGQINFATSPLDPGSAFKIFNYAALINGSDRWGAGSTFYDYRTIFTRPLGDRPGYTPYNYTKKHEGPITMRQALGRSVNIPAVKAMYLAGIDDVHQLARATGIESQPECGNNYCGLASAIGGGIGLRLDELTNAYASFGRLGVYKKLTYIKQIRDRSGRLVYSWQNQPQRVLNQETAYIINDILSDPGARFSQSFNINNLPMAIKTGTSDFYRSNLILGYTPRVAYGLWFGHHDASKTFGESYTTSPKATALKTFMESYYRDVLGQTAARTWPQPPGLQRWRVHLETGYVIDDADIDLLASATGQTDSRVDIYPSWYQPLTASGGSAIVIDKVSGKLASNCTPDLARQLVYVNRIRTELEADDPFYWNWLTPINQALQVGQTDDWLPTEFDDVHSCDDQLPQVTVTGPDFCPGRCRLTLTVRAGSHPLKEVSLLTADGLVLEKRQLPASVAENQFYFDYLPTVTSDQLTLIARVVDTGLYLNSDNLILVTQVDDSNLRLEPVIVDRLSQMAQISWTRPQAGLSLSFHQACGDSPRQQLPAGITSFSLDINQFNPGICRLSLTGGDGYVSNYRDFWVAVGDDDVTPGPADPVLLLPRDPVSIDF